MSGQDEARLALRLLADSAELPAGHSAKQELIAEAQVHATLALVAVMAMGPGSNASAWRPVFNVPTTFDEGE